MVSRLLRPVTSSNERNVSTKRLAGRCAVLFAVILGTVIVGSSASPRLAQALDSGGLSYLDIDGESWEVTGCVAPCAENLVIPSSVDGKPVTSIGSSSFYGNSTIITIEIPASVTNIGLYAFSSVTPLTSITVPVSDYFKVEQGMLLTKDGTELVARPKSSLTSLTVPAGVRQIRPGALEGAAPTSLSLPASLEVLPAEALKYLYSLESITVETGNTTFSEIDGVLFNQSTLLLYPPLKPGASYSIPESTTSIAANAFRDTQFLTSLALPSSLSTVVNDSFARVNNLVSITVASGNTAFSGIEGVLYEGDTLIKYPMKRAGTTYSVLPGTTEIGYAAFDSAELLTTVTLPDSLRVIGYDGFVRTTLLTSINLPLGLTTLGSFSLAVSGLTSVVIPHTVLNWNSNVFSYSSVYESVYFEGDAPPESVFADITAGTKIHRIEGTNGWPALGQLYGGLEQVAWNPAITTPRAPSVSALTQSVRVTANRGTGGLPASYLVKSSPGDVTCEIVLPATSCVVTGLTAGTAYTFTTTATKGSTTTASSPASTVVRPVTDQTISFTGPVDRAYSSTPFVVTATTNSNLSVVLTSTTLDVCTVAGLEVSMLTVGTCTLTASAAGNATYADATEVIRSFTISEPPPTTTTPSTENTEAPTSTTLPQSGSTATTPSTENTEAPTSTTLPQSGSTATTTPTTVAPPSESVVTGLPRAETPLVPNNSLSTGGEVTVTFGGFTPFEYVQLIIASTPQVIGSGYANAQGFVTISGNLPATLGLGSHTLAVYAPVSGVGFSQPITVSQPRLPATGSNDQHRLLVVALMLLVGGLMMRRRGLFKSV